jgi:dihydroneopterin aldolase
MSAGTKHPENAVDLGLALGLRQARRIYINNFRTWISMGIHEHEKQAKQPIIVSVDVYLDPASRIQRDSIRETADYEAVRGEIVRIADSGHFHLQETFCERVLAACLEKPGVIAARVCSEKPDAYADCEVGFEIFGVR